MKCIVLFCRFARKKLRVRHKVEVEDPESERLGKLWIYMQFEDPKVLRTDKLLEGLALMIVYIVIVFMNSSSNAQKTWR